ncbi:hypothetical protein MCG98_04310 [Ruminococcus sp. OA3]|uniref:hypothetical protein n=1 Tax=Ruminococcus sp. OA3 TaxID=2914164 RepID=UPI001F0633E4|nr:hypothetical protein [Ruminococcus sp. OA3]MCH1981793.1 hypothetical protein [Ruminococcus sp. OA3]
MFERTYVVKMPLPVLLDYHKYLTMQVRYYQECQGSGCKVTAAQYRRYCKMLDSVMSILQSADDYIQR